jgi:hypothetical protein
MLRMDGLHQFSTLDPMSLLTELRTVCQVRSTERSPRTELARAYWLLLWPQGHPSYLTAEFPDPAATVLLKLHWAHLDIVGILGV